MKAWHGIAIDHRAPSSERQKQLRDECEKNLSVGSPPFAGVRITSRGELEWIIGEKSRTSGSDLESNVRIDLREANLSGTNFGNIALEGADLRDVNLSESCLDGANLNAVDLSGGANLQNASLCGTDFHMANLNRVVLEGADLRGAYLEEADLTAASLYKADLNAAILIAVKFCDADLRKVNLSNAILKRADLSGAILTGANLSQSRLERSNLSGAILIGVNLSHAQLKRADLSGANIRRANLERADLRWANLRGTSAEEVRMHAATQLEGVLLDSQTKLSDVVWNGVPLARVNWAQMPKLGDEVSIVEAKKRRSASKSRRERKDLRLPVAQAYRQVARGYHGLSVTLRSQGLSNFASAYRLRELRMERRALRIEGKFWAWLGLRLLGILSGGGERPSRTVRAYVITITSFAILYYLLGIFTNADLSPVSATILSVISFHGRGFFPSGARTLTDPFVILAAIEAVIGLFIEIIFIATFSRRFLGN
jgi:uncharacterized protein YjbI with pentapeptide repeats